MHLVDVFPVYLINLLSLSSEDSGGCHSSHIHTHTRFTSPRIAVLGLGVLCTHMMYFYPEIDYSPSVENILKNIYMSKHY